MTKINRFLTAVMSNNYIMMAIFMTISISLSIIYRYEVLSDFNNYHYFLPWAFFHGRTFTDIALAMENSYHNPLIEMPIYFISNRFNETPLVLHIYNSLFWGILVFVFYKFCMLRFDITTLRGKILISLTMLLSMTGFALLTQNGTSSNEVPVTIGVMTALYLIYKELFVLKSERLAVFFFSGIIMGMCLGLKLTIVTYCLSLGFTLIIFYNYLKTPYKTIGLFILGGFIGFCITDGWWAYILYREFGNPMFPYLNNIFKSPYYADEFLSYSSFYEKKPLDYLIYPFLASFQGEERITAEAYMVDVRLASGYVLFFICLISLAFKKNAKQIIKENLPTVFLVIFATLGYMVWLQMFSIIRYAIPIEMIICLMIVTFLAQIKPKTLYGFTFYCSFCIIFLFVLLSGLPYTSWGHRHGFEKIINVERIILPEKSLLLGLSPNVGLSVTQIVKDNPNVKVANETSTFTLPGRKMHDKITEYQEQSDFIGYLVALRTTFFEFDRYTPISLVKNDNVEEVFENLQYIIKNNLGIDKFYCRSISNAHNYNHVFLCMDKKYKKLIFPNEIDYNALQKTN